MHPDPLDARSIRDWCETNFRLERKGKQQPAAIKFPARIVDKAISNESNEFRVLPLFVNENVRWADVAGYVLAVSPSQVTSRIRDCDPILSDFVLNVGNAEVTVTDYV